MKNKPSLILSICIIFSARAFSQAIVSDPVVDMTTASFRELKLKPEEPIETVYLNDSWVNGNVTFKSGYEIKDVPVKYDLRENILEIKTANGIKIAPKAQLQFFEFDHKIEKHTYVDADGLNINGITGLVEALTTGEISLYAKPYVKIIKANYNAALNVGQRLDTYTKDETLILIKDDLVYDITKAGKKVLTYFDEKSLAIQNYVKENGLSYRDRNNLIRIIKKYNSISSDE